MLLLRSFSVMVESSGESVSDTYALTVNSVTTGDIFPMGDQLIQVRGGEIVTKAQASINEYGTDYTGGVV